MPHVLPIPLDPVCVRREESNASLSAPTTPQKANPIPNTYKKNLMGSVCSMFLSDIESGLKYGLVVMKWICKLFSGFIDLLMTGFKSDNSSSLSRHSTDSVSLNSLEDNGVEGGGVAPLIRTGSDNSVSNTSDFQQDGHTYEL